MSVNCCEVTRHLHQADWKEDKKSSQRRYRRPGLCGLCFYFSSLFFIRFMLRTKKTGVTMAIHTMLRNMDDSRLQNSKPLVKFTVWVRGRKSCAHVCIRTGVLESGKNVPLNRNIGVTKRKPG